MEPHQVKKWYFWPPTGTADPGMITSSKCTTAPPNYANILTSANTFNAFALHNAVCLVLLIPLTPSIVPDFSSYPKRTKHCQASFAVDTLGQSLVSPPAVMTKQANKYLHYAKKATYLLDPASPPTIFSTKSVVPNARRRYRSHFLPVSGTHPVTKSFLSSHRVLPVGFCLPVLPSCSSYPRYSERGTRTKRRA